MRNNNPAHPNLVRTFNIKLSDIYMDITGRRPTRQERIALLSRVYGVPIVSTKYLTTGQALALVNLINREREEAVDFLSALLT